MKWTWLVLMIALAACEGESRDVPLPSRREGMSAKPTGVAGGMSAKPTGVAGGMSAKPTGGAGGETAQTPHFELGSVCGDCHGNARRATAMRDADANPIAPYDLWRGTMMANAARDPFFRAQLAAELAAGSLHDEADCLRCHAPMLEAPARLADGPPATLAALDGADTRARLGRDGVSCTVCHQIQPDDLGTPDSFGGRFTIGGERRIYGPHREPWGEIMKLRTDFEPEYGAQLTDPALCGTCHTVTSAGFIEQAAYLEWRNSRFSAEGGQTCQDCHVPRVDLQGRIVETRIARNPHGGDFDPIEARQPYGRHVFVGGNTLVPAILRDHAEALDVRAPAEAFDATIARAREQLAERTATLDIEARRHDDTLEVAVTVVNLTGHKLPTGFPSRRVWLRLEVLGADGAALFDSGGFDARGRLPRDAGGEPHVHYTAPITDASQVQIYAQAMADAHGTPTVLVTQASHRTIDNRLLPAGWRDDHEDASSTRPVSVGDDEDFTAGRDTVHYRIALDPAAPGVTVRATLHYQVLSPGHLDGLVQWSAPQIEAFVGYLESADLRPETLATAAVSVR